MIEIRIATDKDVDVLFDLIIAIAKHHNQTEHVLTTKEELLSSGFAKYTKFGALICYFNKRVAGYVSFTWNYSIWSGGNYMNIDDVFVIEEFRGNKIGEALMKHIKELCLEKNISRVKWEVESDNFGAIKFYERLGAKMVTKGIFNWKV